MIEGAEILKTTELYKHAMSAYTWIVIGVAVVLLILLIIWMANTIDSTKQLIARIGGLVVIVAGMWLAVSSLREIPAGYQYDVYAEDAEAIKALYENYEIISANGNIYTIRDKAE